MMKYIVILLTGSLLFAFINCSGSEFQQTGDDINNLSCLDEECTKYRVTENAYNPIEQKKIDVLFVFDNSPSMKAENNELADKMNGFIDSLNNNKVDYNLCYTLSEPSIFNSGRIQPWTNNQLVLKRSTADIENIFYDTVDMINENTAQTGDEQPIAATYSIFNNPQNRDCFRNNTAINVVYLSDEDENSDGTNLGVLNRPSELISKAKSTFGNVPFMVHSIVAAPDNFACYTSVDENDYSPTRAYTLVNLSKLTKGTVGNLCASNYTQTLEDIYLKIQKTIDSVIMKCSPIAGSLNIKSSNNTSYTSEIRDGRLYLTPGIPADSSVTITYDCLK